MKVEEIKIGTPVTFFQALDENDKKILPLSTFVTSKPFTDEDGDIVCKVDGVSGGVLISHLEKREIVGNLKPTDLEVLKLVEEHFGAGCAAICKERKRQIEVEGFTPDHDFSQYGQKGELAVAAASYAVAEDMRDAYKDDSIPPFWPWNDDWWKPTPDNRPRELEKAGALIAADFDRLTRNSNHQNQS